MEDTRDRVKQIFTKLFKDEAEITDLTHSSDIKAWDSLNHMMLLNDIEMEFGIKFSLDEILSMQRFGEICQVVDQKRKD